MVNNIKFKVVYLEKNEGHGNARRRGLKECNNELVALMDADDISLPRRFEKQIKCFEEYDELSIVGGQITEFAEQPENIIGLRQVPTQDNEIKQYLKKRCPMNQVTVMFKKGDVENAGGYIDWYCEEDYYLWARMVLKNLRFQNVDDVLVNVRVGNEMSARRGGMKYFRSEVRMQRFLLDNKLIGVPRYVYNVGIRFVGEVLAPNSLRAKLFHLFRKEVPLNIKMQNDTEGKKGEASIPFSVSMCVYGGDNPEWFDTALESVISQTVMPDEIVLVVDGPISAELENVIEKYRHICTYDAMED